MCGIAGALYTLTYEIVTFDTVAASMSANALLMTYIGGVGVANTMVISVIERRVAWWGSQDPGT